MAGASYTCAYAFALVCCRARPSTRSTWEAPGRDGKQRRAGGVGAPSPLLPVAGHRTALAQRAARPSLTRRINRELDIHAVYTSSRSKTPQGDDGFPRGHTHCEAQEGMRAGQATGHQPTARQFLFGRGEVVAAGPTSPASRDVASASRRDRRRLVPAQNLRMRPQLLRSPSRLAGE